MKAIFKTFQDNAGDEISGHLEKTNDSATIEKGQVKDSSGWYRTTNPSTALARAKENHPDIQIIKHVHVNFNGYEKSVKTFEKYMNLKDIADQWDPVENEFDRTLNSQNKYQY